MRCFFLRLRQRLNEDETQNEISKREIETLQAAKEKELKETKEEFGKVMKELEKLQQKYEKAAKEAEKNKQSYDEAVEELEKLRKYQEKEAEIKNAKIKAIEDIYKAYIKSVLFK
jgi:hypothetical protein